MQIFEPLEPRILLSADIIPLPTDADVSDITAPVDDIASSDSLVEQPTDAPPSPDSTEQSTSVDIDQTSTAADDPVLAVDPAETSIPSGDGEADLPTSQEIIFINDDIEGFEELAGSLTENPDSTVIVLDSSSDGVSQVSKALEETDGNDAIHFFTHATDGNLKIGSTWISDASLSQYESSISTWGESLKDDGDILFYGCDLAASPDGQSLMDDIAGLTGADVAASIDTTGSPLAGGDWILEYHTGEIEAAVAVTPELQSDWVHILAEEYAADSFDTASYAGDEGSVSWTSDWVEIGESDGASSGNVSIDNGELLVITASSNGAERGISRTVDLSDATSAYLSFQLDDYWASDGDRISFQVRTDDTADWVSLDDHIILFISDVMQKRYDITDYATATTEIRFVSAGENLGGLSEGIGYVYIDNLRIDYTTDAWSSALWLSTKGDVTDGATANVGTWESSDLISLDNSHPLLGVDTSGEFSMGAQLSTFADGANIEGLHYVTTTMTIGDSGFLLEKGDILFCSSDATSTSFGGVGASQSDIILFRPTTPGDYSAGSFSILFDEITTDKLNGITLVESDVTVGDRDLSTGDLLFTTTDSNIYHFATTDVEGSGTTSGTTTILFAGDDSGISISAELRSIDLIERTVTIGNQTLEQGTLLLSASTLDAVGSNNLLVLSNDIFTLEATSTSSPDGSTANLGNASSFLLFDATDASLDGTAESIDALSLTVQGEITGPIFTGVVFDADEMTITLTGENLDYIGDIGENVKDRLDWTKITWDINNDGDTTADIDFTLTNVSTVLTTPTTLVINLTGQKTIEITGTTGYGADGGIDTLTIESGFVSNAEGVVATTDGLIDAPIFTSTGPQGVALSNSSLEENLDTTGGEVVGTLSTTDPDGDETFTYTITGGADAGYFQVDGDQLIIDAGILDFETKSSYTVTITVTEGSGQTAEETHTILVTNIDETPQLLTNTLTVSEDGSVTLTAANLAATDPETVAGSLVFNVTALSGGTFFHADTGVTTSFSQADLNLGKISFVDDGDENPPSYSISVFDGSLTTTPETATITFQQVNDAPVITANSLTIAEGGAVTLTGSDLAGSDPDTDPANLTFAVASVSGGQFELTGSPGTSITSFTLEQVNNSEVVFQHDGHESAPAYTLTLSDTGLTSDPSSAVISYSPVNDVPVLQQNYITINQSSNLNISPANLFALDADAAAADLTYTITDLEHGYFRVNGSIETEFTQAEIEAGVVVFYQDGSASAPEFNIEVTDENGASSGVQSANIYFNTVNQAPSFVESSLTVSEGQTVTLTTSDFYTTDIDNPPASLTYTITSVSSGYFELASGPGIAVTTFTQYDVNMGAVRFVHDGGESAPDFTATVSDGEYSVSPAGPSDIHFTNVNDAPYLSQNTLTINEGQTVTITASNLSAGDDDNVNATLEFHIDAAISGGNFALKDTTTPIFSFTRAQVDAGDIVFIHDGSDTPPSYTVSVSDGSLASSPQAASINFTATNDAPVLSANGFTVTEGGMKTITTGDIGAIDEESAAANLTFTVTDVTAGYFAYSADTAAAISTFTQGEILGGNVVFIHDGSENTPAYTISVADDDASPLTTGPENGTVTLIHVNDAPDLSVNSLTICEGETLRLDNSMIAAIDEDSVAADLTYSVTDLVAGIFVHEDAMDTPITVFSQTDLANGKIYIVHNGSETPLACSIAVSDGTLSTPPSPTSIVFINLNDAPTIINTATNQTYVEDSPLLLSGIYLEDVDEEAVYQVTLELSDPLAGAFNVSANATAAGTFDGGVLTITGTDLGDINDLLAATVFTPADNYDQDVSITIRATDFIDASNEAVRTLHPVTSNDAPEATLLNQVDSYIEDVPFDFDDIVVSDVDSNEVITATLRLDSPTHGRLTTAGGADYDSASGVWTISGSVTEVNNALAQVSFVPAADSFASTCISVTIEDGHEDGAATLTGTLALTGTSAGDAPLVSSATTLPATPTDLIYITKNPVDGEEITSFRITSIENGELSLADGTVVENGDFITLEEGAAGLIFTPDSDENGSFAVQASEDGLVVPVASETTTATITVTAPASPVVVGGGDSSASPDTGSVDTTSEEVVSDTSVLDLVTGQETTLTTETMVETADIAREGSNVKEPEPEKDNGQDDSEQELDAETSGGINYSDAKVLAESTAFNEIEVLPDFGNLEFDVTLNNTTVPSISLSTAALTNSQQADGEMQHSDTSESVRVRFSSGDYSLVDLEYRERSFEEYQSVRQSLAAFHEEASEEMATEKTVVGSAIATSAGLSAGYVIWLLRSGALLSSILSSLPAWQLADPLAVLTGSRKGEDDDDDSLESIIEQGAERPVVPGNAQTSEHSADQAN